MEKGIRIRFSFPEFENGRTISAQEAEVFLRGKVLRKKGEYVGAVRKLAHFYNRVGKLDEAEVLLDDLMQFEDDPETVAGLWLGLGQLAEKRHDFQRAVSLYRKGLRMEPASTFNWYFLHNNLGYSLNQIGEFQEAEPYLRTAIEIDGNIYNAYKNLGLSLIGQMRYVEAARALIQATQTNAADSRAFGHLVKLVKDHPELLDDVPELSRFLNVGQPAVDAVANIAKLRQQSQRAKSPALSDPERIAVAVARLVQEMHIITFQEDDVITAMGIPRENWLEKLTTTFQEMVEREPPGEPTVDSQFQGVFRRVSAGNYILTERGEKMVQEIDKLLDQSD